MLLVIVSVLDLKVKAFGRPFFARTNEEAVRSFTGEVNRAAADNPLSAYPQDFVLYSIGTFDDETGKVEDSANEILLTGDDARKVYGN